MRNVKCQVTVFCVLAALVDGSVHRPGRADSNKVCDNYVQGCPGVGQPGGTDRGCSDPPQWGTGYSCEQVELLEYGKCVTGVGFCITGDVTCASVQGYGGATCKNGTCDLNYPVGSPKAFTTRGCGAGL